MSSNTTVAQSVPPGMFRPSAVVREFFPDADDDACTHILWEYTGWPSFFQPVDGETNQDCLRRQVKLYKERDYICVTCRVPQIGLGLRGPDGTACSTDCYHAEYKPETTKAHLGARATPA